MVHFIEWLYKVFVNSLFSMEIQSQVRLSAKFVVVDSEISVQFVKARLHLFLSNLCKLVINLITVLLGKNLSTGHHIVI